MQTVTIHMWDTECARKQPQSVSSGVQYSNHNQWTATHNVWGSDSPWPYHCNTDVFSTSRDWANKVKSLLYVARSPRDAVVQCLWIAGFGWDLCIDTADVPMGQYWRIASSFVSHHPAFSCCANPIGRPLSVAQMHAFACNVHWPHSSGCPTDGSAWSYSGRRTSQTESFFMKRLLLSMQIYCLILFKHNIRLNSCHIW
jgi:hypothetical protein